MQNNYIQVKLSLQNLIFLHGCKRKSDLARVSLHRVEKQDVVIVLIEKLHV